MMDVILFFSVPAILLAGATLWRKFDNSCKHLWGNWIQEETEYAYVQHRACTHCGYTEREQFRKMIPNEATPSRND